MYINIYFAGYRTGQSHEDRQLSTKMADQLDLFLAAEHRLVGCLGQPVITKQQSVVVGHIRCPLSVVTLFGG